MTLFCPCCNARDTLQPVLSPLLCEYVNSDSRYAKNPKYVQQQRLNMPFIVYICQRCDWGEIYEKVLVD